MSILLLCFPLHALGEIIFDVPTAGADRPIEERHDDRERAGSVEDRDAGAWAGRFARISIKAGIVIFV